MAQLDINVKATGIEKTTRDIKSLDNEINKVSKDSKNATTTIGDLSNSISNLSTRTVAVAGSIAAIGKAFYDLTKQGIQYKSLLEDQLTGLTALRVATTKNIDSMGNALTLSQKYNIAQKESLTTLKELQEVNKRTPQQLLETVELYKVLVPTLGKTGASQKELLQVTELLAKASAAYGIQFQQLIAGADGLASGTVEVNSELGRFLKTLGLSNDALKDTNNVSQLVIDKLKPMSGELDTLTVANSNLTNAWNELTGVLAEPIFEPVKESVKVLTKYLEDATVALSKFFDTFRDAENLGSIEQLNTRMVDVYQKIQDKQKQLDEAFSWNKGKYSAELRALNVELLATAQEYEKFTNSAETATLVIEKQAVKTENNTTKVRTHTKAIQEQRDVLTTSTSDWQTYYETIGDYSTAWYFEEAELRSRFIDLSSEQFDELIKVAKEKYFDKFKEEVEILKTEAFDDFMKFEFDVDTSGLDKVGKALNTMRDAFKDLGNEQQLYTKAINEAGKDEGKLAKIRDQHLTNEIDGYSMVAGAAAGMFEENSKGYKVLIKLQQALQIVNQARALSEMMTAQASVASAAVSTAAKQGEAVAGAAAAVTTAGTGDPYTAPMRVAAMLALMTSVLSMFGLSGGGGSGGGSSVSVPSVADAAQEALDFENTMVIDRLDRQIELLEQLNLQGSAAKLQVQSAKVQFDYEKATSINDIRKTMEENLGEWQSKDQVAIFNAIHSDLGYEGDIIDYFSSDSPEKIWLNFSEKEHNGLTNWWSTYIDVTDRQFMEMRNEFQNKMSDFALDVIGTINNLKDAGKDLKETYDELTDSQKYANMDLMNAIKQVDTLRGERSFANYIEDEIENITKLEKELTADRISLLLSEDIADMRAKVDLINYLSAQTGIAFENGAEDVLNYIDAIEMVSEAMITSRENINAFINSFKNSENLLVDSALKIGTSVATTWDELAKQYKDLSGDLLGLTDDELSYLNQAKKYIEELNNSLIESQKDVIQEQINGYNDLLATVRNNMSKLDSIMSSLTSTIETLRGASNTSEVSLMKFWASLAMTRSLSTGTDYEALSKSVQQTSSYSSALTQGRNFASASDMIFAQKSAANDLADINFTLESEYDVLKAIEENTADTVEALTAKLTQIGTDISSSNTNLSDAIKDIIGATTVDEYNTSIGTVKSAFQSVLGYTPDTSSSGFQYWVKELNNNPNITASNLESSIARGASTYSDIDSAINWFKSNNIIQGMQLLENTLASGIISNYEANKLLDKYGILGIDYADNILQRFDYATFKGLNTLTPFYSGGYTGNGGKYDAAGIVHKGEYVVNQEQLRSVGGVAGLESRMSSNNGNLEALVGKLIKENVAMRKLWEQVTLNGNRMKVELVS